MSVEIFLVSGYLGDGGGAERQIVELATGLDRDKYSPVVIALVAPSARSRHGGHHYRRLVEAGVEVITLAKRTRAGLGQIVALSRLMRRRRPVLAHSFLYSMNWRTRVAALAAPSVRVIASERSVNTWKRGWHHAVERILLPRTDRIVANAGAIRRFLVETGGIPERKIEVIFNGVDVERFRPAGESAASLRTELGWPPDALLLGHSGTLLPHKGQDKLLMACARAANRLPPFRVVLFGDGPDRSRLTALAAELGLGDRLDMPGFVPDVERRLAALDLYVHLSQEREGCSNAILEAMACGLPVVATTVGGNVELVADGETGICVGEEDVDAAAEAIASLGVDPERRRELGRAGRQRACERFALERMVERTEALYDEIRSGT